MSAQSWSVKGIDPKVREAVREAAARQGMTLGEYLNQALQNRDGQRDDGRPRPRVVRANAQPEDLDDWLLSAPQDMTRDSGGLARRVEAIERRTQLAVTGLDRAVSTMDRTVLGLSGRVDDAETIARESAERITEALSHFRAASDALSGRLSETDAESRESRAALQSAAEDMSTARAALTRLAEDADAAARQAEISVAALTHRVDAQDAVLDARLSTGLVEARAAAEAAAREAERATQTALDQMRVLQADMSRRLSESEGGVRAQVDVALEATRKAHAALADRVTRGENEFRRAYEGLAERAMHADSRARTVIEEAAADMRAAQAALSLRIETAEQGGREATAGLRQAAGAAIADLRNAQLGLGARLKLIEEGSGGGAGVDLSAVHAAQAALGDRLARLEGGDRALDPRVHERLAQMEQALAHAAREEDLERKLAAFDRKLAEAALDPMAVARLDAMAQRVEAQQTSSRTIEESLARLTQRLAETETTANTAIRTLEETVAGLGARMTAQDAHQETEALRAMLEHRLDEMAQSVSGMVAEARSELAGKGAAPVSDEQVNALEGDLADVNRRLAAAERRQAQTIEAISIEIKRMSETVDRRLRAVETREDGGADMAVREELARLAHTLEGRFEEIERREAAAFDRMGLEVGRLSERLEERFSTVEGRSAQAIEQVGEQVARMAERFNQRQEQFGRELNERVADSEERSRSRISDAVASLMQRMAEVEASSVEAVTPMARAMSTVATRLQALEDNDGDIPTPARRAEDAQAASPEALFGELETAPPPMAEDDDDEEAGAFFDLNDDEPMSAFVQPPPPEQAPVRAGPLPPLPRAEIAPVVEPAPVAMETPPPPIDEEPFWESDAATETREANVSFDVSPFDDDLTLDAPLPPILSAEAPAKSNDYLANARRAAQAQATPVKGRKDAAAKPRKDDKPAKLRGSSRVVLWGAAGAVALMVAGGAYVMNRQDAHPNGAAPTPTPQPPQALEPQPAQPPVAPFDASAAPSDAAPATDADAATATADPASAPAEAPTPAAGPAPHAAPAPRAAPVASATPRPTVGAAAQATAVAAPLPPRAISLDQAAARGDAVAQYELSLQRIAAGRAEEGVTMLRQAANQNLAMAQYRLAKLYERGEGVPADLTQARNWTERAAAGGNRRAMHDLGVYFARGEGAPLDEAAAFRWFRQAAELGVADSQYNLGVLYQQGRGVVANPAEALFWYLVAARQGDEDAGARGNALESTLQPIQVEQARARAEAFRPRAASARANGEFGPRPWAASAPTRSGA